MIGESCEPPAEGFIHFAVSFSENLMKNLLAVVLLVVSSLVGREAAAITLTEASESQTSLQLKWTWDPTEGFATQDLDFLTNWDVILFALPSAGEDPAKALINATHTSAPHTGDALTGTPFLQLSSPGDAVVNSTKNHLFLPDNTFHYDLYTFEVSAVGADGLATISLSAVHAIPEPATYALMIAGLALLRARTTRKGTPAGRK